VKTVRVGMLASAAAAVATTAAAGSPPPPAPPPPATPPPAKLVGYYDPTWSPDGKRIAFVDRGDVDGDLYVMNADGTGVKQLTHSSYSSGDYGARNPSWSPDGRRIAFAYGYDRLSVINPDGSGLRTVVHPGDLPDWSPKGRWIAYAQFDEPAGSSLFVIRPDATHKTLVERPDGYHSYGAPTWSPDGQRLAFGVGTAGDTPIQTPYVGVISQYRGRITKLAVGHSIWSTDWSPNGRSLLLSEDPIVNDPRGFENVRVSILDLRTRKLRPLHRGLSARWSPNGRRIVFAWRGAIDVMNADGSGVRQLHP
jgi:Tol biopolymer transport system component